VPFCKCGNLFRDGVTAYCVKCGFETRASDSTADSARKVGPDLGGSIIGDDELRSPGESAALLVGLGLLAVSWVVFDVASDVIPLLVVSVGLIVYALYQQGTIKGSAVAVSPRSFPDVEALAQNAAVRLGIEKPNLFIRSSPELNAYAMGFWGSSCVVLHSATVHTLQNAPQELQFVIGHEFTHIKCSHVAWQTVAAKNPVLGRIPVLNVILPLFFSWWSRQAELTADRGGLIACGDLAASQRALARLAIGPDLFDRLNMEEFIKQADDGGLSSKAGELFSSHPSLAKRILALSKFDKSPLRARARKSSAARS
jgi:Zn-dependent protease with chaperone function